MSPPELARHSSSDWSSHPRQPGDPLPFLILFPSTTKEVSEIMKICYKRRLPVTAFSGGTSLEGHFAPTRGSVVIDFQRMDKILKIHDKDLDAVVQPAVGWEYLNEELKKDNLFFPPDPGPGAMIGGMEWVLSLTVALADGTVIKTRQRPRKSSAGYDLTRTFIGSEGTLGLVTEITLKLAVKPPNETVAVANFSTIREVTDVVEKVVSQGIQVAAVELLGDVQMKCINDSGGASEGYYQEVFTKAGFEFAKNAEEVSELWEARKEALWSVIALGSHVRL
ncbi:FAD-binding domain-containing protein [Terfezia boudieri ATCC MYA-4762]|uniref:FAD-binding domain-containing protein n=1 Tax=Terfezia boudieri ATCC MYA-4762 TaxID=1051890 RepID=A0A3N4M087_9PEZI|nr:FAD-binding domain-containing protein [Terfezia boudieri ATCC MYA-4762]